MITLVATTVALVLAILVVVVRTRAAGESDVRRPAPAAVRSVVVTGSYGAGHDVAARRIVEVLERAGRQVELLDIVDAYPLGTGRILRRLYFAQLNACPRTWDWTLRLLSSDGAWGRRVSRCLRSVLAVLPRRRLTRSLVGAVDLVVSTHPFASAALSRMRETGALSAPVATYLTDPSVHALWVHPGVDVHVAIYQEAARQARRQGARGVVLVRPLAPSRPSSRRRAQVLAEVGVPVGPPVALVVGGSEGVGDLLASAGEIASSGLATPVVVCGHNDVLRAQVGALPGAIGVPWQDGLDALVAAADLVVQNAGGSTALEALAMGTPVVSHRCIPGHGEANAAALAAEGLAPWPRSYGGLVDALADALVAERMPPASWNGRCGLTDALGIQVPVAVAA